MLSYKDHNGILSLSTLKPKGNRWEHLDFYDSPSLLTEFIEEWIYDHPGVENKRTDDMIVGFALYNDTYLHQNPSFKKEPSGRRNLILNRHVSFRVEPRLFHAPW